MSTAIESREQEIKEIVCDILELEPEEVTETSLFKAEHGADSLRAIEILANLERSFGVVIDQAELAVARDQRLAGDFGHASSELSIGI